jgi:mannose-6-phosphate isomerase-like protein (cupin superfamily)
MEEHKKVWGSEEWIANTEKYCGKILNLKKGYRCSIHHHKNKDETFYIMSGEVLMEVNGKGKIMKKGEVQRIMPGEKHRFTGLASSKVIEFSTHHEESDSYRDTESGKADLNEIKQEFNI